MSNKNCGCNNGGSQDGDYLMVKATASEASTCAPGTSGTGTESCDKQEPMFDTSLSDFVLPNINGSTSMQVCNASIYSVGMWLQFFTPVATLQISNITGNILGLVNRCPNGQEIDDNPTVGTVVNHGTPFIVTSEPQCLTDAEDMERIESALATMTQLCVPNMATSSSTAVIRPVGKIESDPSDLGVKKCIKAIYGILFKAGTPILTALGLKEANDIQYRRLAKHKTTNEVVHLKNYMETPGLTAESYALLINKNTEKVIPTYFSYMSRNILHETNTSSDPNDWPVLASGTPFEDDYSVDIAGFGDLFSDRNHLYVMVKLDVGIFSTSAGAKTIKVETNGITVGKVMTLGDLTCNVNTISYRIKVLKSDYNLKLKLSTSQGGVKYYFKLVIEGAHY